MRRPNQSGSCSAPALTLHLIGLLALLSLWARAEEPAFSLASFSRPALTNAQPFIIAPTNAPALFQAIVSRDWLPGLVPMFVVEKEGRRELRRLPARGQENFAEPLFFALPPEDEAETAAVAGRWELTATRADGSKPRLAVELATDREQVAARLDQNTDYRFAYITKGSIHTNRLELRVEYIKDVYLLSVDRRNDRWLGRWRLEDDTEGGSLELWRGLTQVAPPPGLAMVALHECSRAGDDARLYVLADEPVPAGWKREARPLCRVWRTGADKPAR